MESIRSNQFKIGLCQMRVGIDKATNLARAGIMLHKAADMGANLLVLPEMWVCPCSPEYFAQNAEELDDIENPSPTYSMLSQVAHTRGVTIIGGSMPVLKHGHMYNTCCVFGPDGKLKAKFSKLHLFDFYASDGESFIESDSFTAGDSPTLVETDVGRIGIGICHDIRFAELAMLYRGKGADLIVYPGAFNISTGEMLWELETKARAVDNQLFVAVCSPSRDSVGSYAVWGHSMVVSPSGEVKANGGHEEKVVIVEIDYSENQQQRELFDLKRHDNGSIYHFCYIDESKSDVPS